MQPNNQTDPFKEPSPNVPPVSGDSAEEQPAGKGTTPDTTPCADAAAQQVPGASGRISRYAILGLLVAVSIGIYPIIKVFIIPILLAATFSTLFFPLYTRILKMFKGNRGASSFATCLILFLCLIIPSYVVMHLVVLQMIHFYQSAEPLIKTLLAQGGSSDLIRKLQAIPLVQRLNLESLDLAAVLSNGLKTFLSVGTQVINKTSAGFFGLFTTILIMFFTMFYFFMDGEKFVKRIKFLSPIRDDYEDLIFARFLMISRATVLGTVIIGIIQGSLGAVTLFAFGIRSWLLWGVIMIFLSLIPLVGSWMVLVPAGIFQIVNGHVWQGICIIAISTVLISNIDNVLRPRLVGREAKLHDLVIFFSSLGGIAAFGVMGFIVGPVVAALFVSVLDIYSTEFETQLKKANSHLQ